MGDRYAPKPQFSTPQGQYTAFLEALLVGHEDWVHSVQWQSSLGQGPGQGLQAQPLCLLSTSMDRTMMLWRPDPLTGQLDSSPKHTPDWERGVASAQPVTCMADSSLRKPICS